MICIVRVCVPNVPKRNGSRFGRPVAAASPVDWYYSMVISRCCLRNRRFSSAFLSRLTSARTLSTVTVKIDGEELASKEGFSRTWYKFLAIPD